MLINKFYDAAIADTAGGGAAVVESLSPAALMAKSGIMRDENTVETPIQIPEKKEEVKSEEPVATATVETPSSEEKPASETPQEVKTEEPIKVETPPIAVEPVKVPTLDEVLKNNQPGTVLKALGFDDEKVDFVSKLKDADPKLVAIMQAYEKGTLGDYVKELSTDYQKMTAEDLMRHQLRIEYPKASDRALTALYKTEVTERYKLDPDTYSEEEVENGKLLLEAKADKYRDEFTANQEKYLLPNPPEPKAAPVPDNTAELKAKENVDSYVREISNDPYTKDIFTNKKITLGEGESKFSFPVDPQALVKNLSDAETWVSNMFENKVGVDGKEYSVPKTQHQMLVATVAQYGTKFLDAYALHFKGLGGKEVIEPIDNASPPDNSTPAKGENTNESPAAAAAKRGTYTQGGYN